MNEKRRVPFGPITGLDERHFPTVGSLAVATNVRVDDQGAWAQCRGVTPLYKYITEQQPTSPLAGKGEIETMTWLSQHQGGRQWLLWEQRTSTTSTLVDLVAFSGSERSFRVVSGSRRFYAGPWLKTQYLAHNDWLYYVNGYDAPERWNGRWKTRIGFDQAAGAPLIQNTNRRDWLWLKYGSPPTASQLANGYGRRGVGPRPENWDSAVVGTVAPPVFYKYGYAVTYLNDLNQESPASEIRFMDQEIEGWDAADPTDYFVGKMGNLILLPTPPAHVRGMRLWRTQNVQGIDPSSQVQANLYLLAEFPNAIECVYADLKADDELGRILDRSQLGPFPASARLLAMFRGCMFVAVATGNTSTLQYSASGFIEQFPVDNTLPIGDSDSGHITAMYAMKDALVVFKVRGVYLVRQQANGYFRAETLTEDDGCSSAKSVVEVPGLGLLFVSTAGIRMLSGALANEGVPTRIDSAFDARVRDTFQRRASISQLVSSFSVVNHQDREVWIQIPENGATRPSFGIVYHYEADAWSIREGWGVSCGVETHDHRGVVYFGSNTAVASLYEVYQYTNSVEVTTAPFLKAAPMTRRGAQMVWDGADVYTVNFGSGRTLAMSAYINRRVRPETDSAESRALIDTESEGITGEWGTAQWDTGYWGAAIVQPVRYSVHPPGTPTDIQWGLTGTRFALYGLDLDVVLNQQHKIDASVSAPWVG